MPPKPRPRNETRPLPKSEADLSRDPVKKASRPSSFPKMPKHRKNAFGPLREKLLQAQEDTLTSLPALCKARPVATDAGYALRFGGEVARLTQLVTASEKDLHQWRHRDAIASPDPQVHEHRVADDQRFRQRIQTQLADERQHLETMRLWPLPYTRLVLSVFRYYVRYLTALETFSDEIHADLRKGYRPYRDPYRAPKS